MLLVFLPSSLTPPSSLLTLPVATSLHAWFDTASKAVQNAPITADRKTPLHLISQSQFNANYGKRGKKQVSESRLASELNLIG